ncbi:MAG: hypothetical protein AAFW46_10015 [Pseudomonadota bacterium]
MSQQGRSTGGRDQGGAFGSLRAFAAALTSLGARERLDGRMTVHFLHIGKTAGTQVRMALKKIARRDQRFRFRAHPHRTGLKDLPADAAYFFTLRDPISRFRSGFYSRKRQGRPRYDSPWSDDERRAFERFEHANDLAEALFRDDADGRAATAAMLSIVHVFRGQAEWFARRGAFLEAQPPLAILRQEHLSEDWGRFMTALGIDARLAATAIESGREHVNDYSGVPPLSERAIANLERWYAADRAFHRMCSHYVETMLDAAAPSDAAAWAVIQASTAHPS